MAQSLDDRIAAALKPASRLADCEAVLSDAKAEQERVAAHKADAERRSLDPSRSTSEAEEAQLEAAADELRLRRLARAIECLSGAVETKKAQAVASGQQRHYEQVQSRRDKLADELREHVAPALALIASYCQRIKDSDTEISALNRKLPDGCVPLTSAEQIARGYAGHIWGGDIGHANVERLVDMHIPHFDRARTAWPDVEGNVRREREMQQQIEARRHEGARKREATKARFTVRKPAGFTKGFVVVHHADGTDPLRGAGLTVDLYPEQVKLAETQGLSVTPVAAPAMAVEQ